MDLPPPDAYIHTNYNKSNRLPVPIRTCLNRVTAKKAAIGILATGLVLTAVIGGIAAIEKSKHASASSAQSRVAAQQLVGNGDVNAVKSIGLSDDSKSTDDALEKAVLDRYGCQGGDTSTNLLCALENFMLAKQDGVPIQLGHAHFLYLGSAGAAYNAEALQSTQITHVISATVDTKFMFAPTIKYLRVDVDNSCDDDEDSLYPSFDLVYDFIEEARQNHGRVLIQGHEGISRPVTLVISYYIRKFGMTRHEALDRIRNDRPQAAPLVCYWNELKLYEADNGVEASSMDQMVDDEVYYFETDDEDSLDEYDGVGYPEDSPEGPPPATDDEESESEDVTTTEAPEDEDDEEDEDEESESETTVAPIDEDEDESESEDVTTTVAPEEEEEQPMPPPPAYVPSGGGEEGIIKSPHGDEDGITDDYASPEETDDEDEEEGDDDEDEYDDPYGDDEEEGDDDEEDEYDDQYEGDDEDGRRMMATSTTTTKANTSNNVRKSNVPQ